MGLALQAWPEAPASRAMARAASLSWTSAAAGSMWCCRACRTLDIVNSPAILVGSLVTLVGLAASLWSMLSGDDDERLPSPSAVSRRLRLR